MAILRHCDIAILRYCRYCGYCRLSEQARTRCRASSQGASGKRANGDFPCRARKIVIGWFSHYSGIWQSLVERAELGGTLGRNHVSQASSGEPLNSTYIYTIRIKHHSINQLPHTITIAVRITGSDTDSTFCL